MNIFAKSQTFESWIQTEKLPQGFILRNAHAEDDLGVWRWIQISMRIKRWHSVLVLEISGNSVLVHGSQNLIFAQELTDKFRQVNHKNVTIEVAEPD
jgi:hypothetical protein